VTGSRHWRYQRGYAAPTRTRRTAQMESGPFGHVRDHSQGVISHGGRKETWKPLLSELDGQRAHVLGTLEGLSDDSRRRPVLPSGWTCLGLLQPLALDVERFWFCGIVAGQTSETGDSDSSNAGVVPQDIPAESVLERSTRDTGGQPDHRRGVAGCGAGVLAVSPVAELAARHRAGGHLARDQRDLCPCRPPRRRSPHRGTSPRYARTSRSRSEGL
jgi:Protein of unknown function (DUF664)